MSTSSRAASLLGLAWGDVLGCPVEYWSGAQIASVYGRYDRLPAAAPWDRLSAHPQLMPRLRPIGLYSDDTQQALTLIHACLHVDGWNVDRWARSLSVGAKRKAWRGTGKNFRTAVKRIEAGLPALTCGVPSAGIGSAMRIGPVGQLLAHEPDRLQEVVLESTLVTHSDLRSASLAFAVAYGCAAFAAGRDVDHVRRSLPGAVDGFEERSLAGSVVPVAWAAERGAVARTLGELLPLLGTTDSDRSGMPELRRRLIASASAHGIASDDPGSLVNHPFVLLGGVHAVCCGLAAVGRDPVALLFDLVRQGGDTDTVAAIAGSLLGARCAEAWIPVDRIVNCRALVAYADGMAHDAPTLHQSFDDFVAREAEMSSIERRYEKAVHDTARRDACQSELDARYRNG